MVKTQKMVSIAEKTFITDTLNAVDKVIGNFVQTAYQHLVQGNEVTITLLFTFYIMLLGYRFVAHTLNADLNSIARHLIVFLMVYSLIMQWDLYNVFIYNVFTNESSSIAQVIIDASGKFPSSQGINQALNSVYAAGMEAADYLMGMGNWNNFRFFFYGVAVAGFTFLSCVFALALIIYAKMAMAVGLALGPLFIIFVLWESTRGWFVSWIQKLFNFALIPIVASGILALMLSVIHLTIPTLNAGIKSGEPNFFQLVIFGSLSLMTAFLLKQTLAIASALSGGVTLEGLGKLADMVKSSMHITGVNRASGIAANVGRQGLRAGIHRVSRAVAARRAENRKKAAVIANAKQYPD